MNWTVVVANVGVAAGGSSATTTRCVIDRVAGASNRPPLPCMYDRLAEPPSLLLGHGREPSQVAQRVASICGTGLQIVHAGQLMQAGCSPAIRVGVGRAPYGIACQLVSMYPSTRRYVSSRMS